ncbi:flagellar hook-length control protein FliK [Mesobacterium sp. TK19101]|uniref:Flagellar hook-length control protein FliK n=1 Tax=Mesobacterium hydrothermale TaxID=3111907 RepID=A0ABU6HKD9_9RHOB|nr:flagellar hook-length control protein FliK [Mesobacterium sp. TK19101]MEC3861620.1 flagellar hook-length control protein FliK [Mesobacterium sp. TK19101]
MARITETALPSDTAAPRAATSVAPSTTLPPVHRQLAVVIAQGDGGVTVRLAPEELGQVSIRLHSDDGSLRLVIHADRADTADLIRRNVAPLVDEMTRLGYDRVAVDISGGQGGPAQDRRHPMPQVAPQDGADLLDMPPPETPQRRNAPTSGMDLRL